MNTNSLISKLNYNNYELKYIFTGAGDEIERVKNCIDSLYNEQDVDCVDDEDVVNNKTNESDMVTHPSHYNRYGALETIWEMVALYGIEETKSFCKLNAHKYRARANLKGGEEDMKKSDYYIKWYTYLATTPDYEVMDALQKKYDKFNL